MKRSTVLGLLFLVLMAALSGCNAARGAGKDIGDAGKHIENIGK